MPAPQADSYITESGGSIRGGKNAIVLPNSYPPSGVSRLAAFVGDSLTEHNFGSTPFYWLNGLLDAPLQIVANSGFSGQTIFGMIGQIENNYREVNGGGLIGLPPMGWGFLRLGTNNAKGSPIDVGYSSSYVAVITRMLDFFEHVVIFPVPPVGGSLGVLRSPYIDGYNDFLKTQLSSRVHWIEDCQVLVNEYGNAIPEYFLSDQIHMAGDGPRQMALSAEQQLRDLLSNQSYGNQLSTSALDVYPAQPQWNTNHTNTGSGGTFGYNWSGVLPDGYRIENYGGHVGSGICSIVAADIGDPNQTPWVDIAPTLCSITGSLWLQISAGGRSVTAIDPDTVEQLVEIKFNNFVNFTSWQSRPVAGGRGFTKWQYVYWGQDIVMNRKITLQMKYHRMDPEALGGANIHVFIGGARDASGAMGSIRFRCLTVRG